MYEKYRGTGANKDTECAENLAGVLHDLGKRLYVKEMYNDAAEWLERALDELDEQELERLSAEAGDVRLAIVQQIGENSRESQATSH